MIDPRELALNRPRPARSRGKAPRHRRGEHFLRGPIPMNWLSAAAHAVGHGSGFKVAIALWYLSGLNRQTATVKLTAATLRLFGVDRHASYRGLARLEAAGLVQVDSHSGRAPRVTMLDVPEERT